MVLDASALLAFVGNEPGATTVQDALTSGAVCGAANWSEVAQRVLAVGGDWDLAAALLLSYDIEVAPVTSHDAEWAARRWRHGEGLSLGDRLCLALGHRLGATVMTADRAWGTEAGIRQIR
jgi:ribonuclease VapC